MSVDIWTYNLNILYRYYRAYKYLVSDKICDERKNKNKKYFYMMLDIFFFFSNIVTFPALSRRYYGDSLQPLLYVE